MKAYKSGKVRKRSWLRVLTGLVLVLVVAMIAGFAAFNRYYQANLEPVDPSVNKDVYFTVRVGMQPQQVSRALSDKGLIRSVWVFDQYVRTNELGQNFIAGTYALNKSMSVSDIVDVLTDGKVATDLFTIYPGSNINQIKKSLLETGQYSEAQIDTAFDPSLYASHPALVDLPEGASLEGFLYPDSYHFIAETKVEDIIEQSLDEMARVLDPDIRAGISSQGLSVYQGVILASIVEREVGERGVDGQVNDNRAKVAQVFIKRLNSGMKLESNATDDYPEDYDTYTIEGLPPEPISNVSISSLQAVANPSETNYLFFVSGADCVTRFSETNEQHEALQSQYGVAQRKDNCQG